MGSEIILSGTFENSFDKPQPIRTKIGTHAQTKGWQRSGNVRRDRPSEGKIGGSDESRGAGSFCPVNDTTFRQVTNGRFLPLLASTREYMSLERHWKGFSKMFRLWVTCSSETKNWRGQAGTLLRPAYSPRDALQWDTVHSTL